MTSAGVKIIASELIGVRFNSQINRLLSNATRIISDTRIKNEKLLASMKRWEVERNVADIAAVDAVLAYAAGLINDCILIGNQRRVDIFNLAKMEERRNIQIALLQDASLCSSMAVKWLHDPFRAPLDKRLIYYLVNHGLLRRPGAETALHMQIIQNQLKAQKKPWVYMARERQKYKVEKRGECRYEVNFPRQPSLYQAERMLKQIEIRAASNISLTSASRSSTLQQRTQSSEIEADKIKKTEANEGVMHTKARPEEGHGDAKCDIRPEIDESVGQKHTPTEKIEVPTASDPQEETNKCKIKKRQVSGKVRTKRDVSKEPEKNRDELQNNQIIEKMDSKEKEEQKKPKSKRSKGKGKTKEDFQLELELEGKTDKPVDVPRKKKANKKTARQLELQNTYAPRDSFFRRVVVCATDKFSALESVLHRSTRAKSADRSTENLDVYASEQQEKTHNGKNKKRKVTGKSKTKRDVSKEPEENRDERINRRNNAKKGAKRIEDIDDVTKANEQQRKPKGKKSKGKGKTNEDFWNQAELPAKKAREDDQDDEPKLAGKLVETDAVPKKKKTKQKILEQPVESDEKPQRKCIVRRVVSCAADKLNALESVLHRSPSRAKSKEGRGEAKRDVSPKRCESAKQKRKPNEKIEARTSEQQQNTDRCKNQKPGRGEVKIDISPSKGESAKQKRKPTERKEARLSEQQEKTDECKNQKPGRGEAKRDINPSKGESANHRRKPIEKKEVRPSEQHEKTDKCKHQKREVTGKGKTKRDISKEPEKTPDVKKNCIIAAQKDDKSDGPQKFPISVKIRWKGKKGNDKDAKEDMGKQQNLPAKEIRKKDQDGKPKLAGKAAKPDDVPQKKISKAKQKTRRAKNTATYQPPSIPNTKPVRKSVLRRAVTVAVVKFNAFARSVRALLVK